MRRNGVVLAVAMLTACERAPENRSAALKLNTFDVEDPSAQSADQPVKAGGPQIAYSYSVTYEFDRPAVAGVQGRQIALCRRLGTTRCVVMKSTLNTPGPGDHIVSDQAVLMVDARLAAEVTRRFDAIATNSGAVPANRSVEAEDVTRQVIDVGARVRAKQALAERLLTIIRSGKGNVAGLVEAERAYAATQEELEAAQGEQASLSQRVAMSRVTVTYAFDDTPGRGSPVAASLAQAGRTLSDSVAALVTFLVAAAPWAIAGAVILTLIRWLRRRMGWRWPRRSLSVPAAADASQP